MPRASRSRHIPVSRSSTPVFPVEIFDYIIDKLGDEVADRSDWQRSARAFRALKSCSIVCTSFRRQVLPYLLKSIRVTFHNRDIFRLTAVLQNNPILALYVQNLGVYISNIEQVPKEVAETLLHFPSLTSLAIHGVYSLDLDIDFCRNLMNTYLESDKLTSLELTNGSHIPLDIVLSCRRLQTLRLNAFFFQNEVSSRSPSTIKHLHICEGISGSFFPISFLSHFPALVTLEIDEDFNTGEYPTLDFSSEGDDIGFPSFKLENLHLNAGCRQDIYQIIEFYLEHARKQGAQAFRSMKELDIVAADDSDLEAVKSLLDDKPALRSLKINAAAHTGSCSSLESFVLHDHLLSSMGTLTSLSLSFPAFHYDDGEYEYLMDVIEALLSSMSGVNVLECLDLRFQLNFDESFKCPTGSSWGPVARRLATQSAFPNLKTVELDINFSIDIGDPDDDEDVRAQVDAFVCGDLELFEEQLGNALQPLDARRGVTFNWSTWACTSWEHTPAIVKKVR